VADAVVSQRILDDGSIVVDLRGELDIAVNDALRHVLVDTIATRRPPHLGVNMRHVTFVDSTGIGALLAGYNAANAAGVGYAVRSVASFVEKQLRTTDLHDRLVAPGGDARSR
jgi:anti-sigma B factor antagonist